MKKVLWLIVILFLMTSSVFAGKTSFYTMENGMKVILKENHAAPLVSSVIIVNAGSKFENDHNNGFTHLLEHMLFNGTETKTREDINEGIKDFGGYINAFTRQEMTGYLVVMPKEFIENGLDIQSDQLFNSILPAEMFPKERDIVVEEIKKDNDVDSYVANDYFNAMKFAGTPYSRPVIGFEEAIKAVTREEVMEYYKKYYVPNNMTAFISGDFEASEMKKLLEKYYGSVPAGEMPELAEFSIEPPYNEKVNIKKFPSRVTMVDISIPGPLWSDPGYFAFDVLSQYLDSDASPLSKALIDFDPSLATNVSVGIELQKEFTMLNISVETNNPENVNAIVKKATSVLKEMTNTEFTEADIRRVVVPNKVYEIKLEEKLHYYGIMKAPYLATCGYDFLANYPDNLSKITPADIVKSANDYFADIQYVASALVSTKGVK